MTQHTESLPVVVLISGSGSNLQALIDAAADNLPIALRAVISNRPEAPGLDRAHRAGIDALTLDHKAFPTREAFDSELMMMIDQYAPGLVILAGFMRILTTNFVRHYHGRLLNIHPSLLPKHQGLHTHQRVLDAGESQHGASVHFVTDELDGGPVVLQARIAVRADDDAESLARRVLVREHEIYPTVVGWFAAGRLQSDGKRAYLDGAPLERPLDLDQLGATH